MGRNSLIRSSILQGVFSIPVINPAGVDDGIVRPLKATSQDHRFVESTTATARSPASVRLFWV